MSEPVTVEEPQIDYFAEAMLMLRGESKMLPRMEHLKAMLVRLAASEQQRNLVTISHIATMLSNRLPLSLMTPAALVFDITAQQIALDLAQDAQSNIVVRLHAPHGLRAPSSTKQ